MKLTSTILCDFINDFKLEVSDIGVCFNGMINFNLPNQNFNLKSEVHMESILSSRFDTIYLLNPLIQEYKMPTFFNDVNFKFLYLQHKGLILAGHMPLFGTFTVSIFPTDANCTENTFRELRARKLN